MTGDCIENFSNGIDEELRLHKYLIAALKKIGSMIYTNDVVIIYEHKRKNLVNSPASIVYASQENLKDILNFQDKHYLKKFQKFMENGDRGYLAYLDGKCVHRSWVIQNPGERVRVHRYLGFRLRNNEVYIHYCETSKNARGKNIYPAVLNKIAEDYPDKKIIISTNEHNIASRRGIEKAGFDETARAKILVMLGMVFRFYTNKNRYEFN